MGGGQRPASPGKKIASGKDTKGETVGAHDSSDDDEDCRCNVCKEPGKRHRTKKNEKLHWVQCDACTKWIVKGCEEVAGYWECRRCKDKDTKGYREEMRGQMDKLWRELEDRPKEEDMTRTANLMGKLLERMNTMSDSMHNIKTIIKEAAEDSETEQRVTALQDKWERETERQIDEVREQGETERRELIKRAEKLKQQSR